MQYLSVFLVVVLLYAVQDSHGTCNDGVNPIATCLNYTESNPNTTCYGGYRILGKHNNAVFIGGRNEIVAVKLTNSAEYTREIVDTCYSNSAVACTRITSTNKEDDCVNYIRAVIPLNGGLYVCGTNALLPRCFFCDYTESPMQLNCNFDGNNDPTPTDTSCLSNYADGTDIFPSLGKVNASSYFSDNMNKLYVGVATDPRTKTKVEIASKGLNTAGMFEGDRVTTRVTNTREVFDADLVGTPFESGDRIYFIFRETAAEYADQVQDQEVGKQIYSRIARVCSKDTGVMVGTAQVWTSYQKIRLECAEENPTGYITYFNEIQDFVYDEAEGMIYAIFTSDRNAPARSALCKYDFTYINDIFDNSDFFGPDTSETNPEWAKPTVPTPRPGLNCSDPATNSDFTRDYPLMYTHAKNDETDRTATDVKPPSLILDDYRFSSLDVSNGWYYIATESGHIIKTNGSDPVTYSMYSVAEEPIKDIMKTDEEGEIFVVTTSHHVTSQNLLTVEKEYKLPSDNNITVKPNTVVSITYTAPDLGSYIVTYENGTAVDEFLFTNETLADEDGNLIIRVNIHVLGNMTVTFGTDCINPTRIETYKKYSEDECCMRDNEWTTWHSKYWRIVNSINSQSTVDRSDIQEQIQRCDDCNYGNCDTC